MGEPSLNVGFTENLFLEIKQADALASLKVWVEEIKKGRNVDTPSTTAIYADVAEVKSALLAGQLDMVTITSEDFFEIEHEVALDRIHFGSFRGRFSIENVLLVRSRSGISRLTDLKGKSLNCAAGDRLGMGELWLDTILLERGAGSMKNFFSQNSVKSSASAAVLPVFFGKTDACLVTRRAYEMIVELNPQVGTELKVLEVSPNLVPAVVCTRASYDEGLKRDLVAALADLHKGIRGQQFLTIFKSDQLIPGTLEDLALTREWVERHRAAQCNVSMSCDSALCDDRPENKNALQGDEDRVATRSLPETHGRHVQSGRMSGGTQP